jgi:hypothetical protein
MDVRTRDRVRQRAGSRCEYCRLADSADEWPFHVDHIIALIHGGNDELENLSWSCTQCNLHKGTNFASIDPKTGNRADLFHPRRDDWHNHFMLADDGQIVGTTPVGRATVRLLDMNGSPQLDLRRALIHPHEYD